MPELESVRLVRRAVEKDTSPQAVMTAWMNSPGHRANILNCSFKEIGLGLGQPNYYWTQDFATRR